MPQECSVIVSRVESILCLQPTTCSGKRRTLQSFNRLGLVRTRWEARREEVDPLADDLTDKEILVQNRSPDVRTVQSLLKTLTGLGAPQHTRHVTTYKTCQTPP